MKCLSTNDLNNFILRNSKRMLLCYMTGSFEHFGLIVCSKLCDNLTIFNVILCIEHIEKCNRFSLFVIHSMCWFSHRLMPLWLNEAYLGIYTRDLCSWGAKAPCRCFIIMTSCYSHHRYSRQNPIIKIFALTVIVSKDKLPSHYKVWSHTVVDCSCSRWNIM